jgi:hypothetical protein
MENNSQKIIEIKSEGRAKDIKQKRALIWISAAFVVTLVIMILVIVLL